MTSAPRAHELRDGSRLVPASPRLSSLDAFRGFDIALMFFVNLSGNRDAFPEWFGHAGWNGGRHGQWLADFVFPWFLFILGAAIPYSMNSGRGRAQSPGRRVLGALRRGVVLYLLGILIYCAKSSMDSLDWANGGFAPKPGTPISWAAFLHWDILPLIGLASFLGVVVYHLPRWVQVALVAGVLAAKWLAMPDLTATVGQERAAWMAARTDWEHAVRSLGWWGTLIAQGLPATCCVVLGLFAGEWLRSGRAAAGVRSLALIGAGGVAAGLALAWSLRFPISKDFFTSTYVLISAGTGAALLGVLHGVLDAWRWPRAMVCAGCAIGLVALNFGALFFGQGLFSASQAHATAVVSAVFVVGLGIFAAIEQRRGDGGPCRAEFFVIYGSNAIAVYVLAELLWTMVWMRWRVQCPGDLGGQVAFTALQAHFTWLLAPIFGGELSRGLGPWLASGAMVMLYWLLSWRLHRRGIFVKV